MLYRVITGDGIDIRKLIKSLDENDKNLMILPETSLDINEQASFLKNIPDSFVGDIITLSPFIISDTPTNSLFISDSNLELKKVKNHIFGLSTDMVCHTILGRHISVSDSAFYELEIIRDKTKHGEKKEIILDLLSKMGDSFEKMNIISILRKRD